VARHYLILVALEHTPDLAGVRTVLDRWGLAPSVTDPLLHAPDGRLPVLGGEATAIETSWLGAGATSVYLQVHGIAATEEQCRLIFELATAGRLILGVEPGPPHLVVCGGTHEAEIVVDDTRPPELETVCFVDTWEQLHRALNGTDGVV